MRYIFRPVGAAEEPAQPGAAQVSALGAEQEPDSHREQQGAAGGDHQVHCRDPDLGRPE